MWISPGGLQTAFKTPKCRITYLPANSFYDIRHPVRRKLHSAYIRKCLDNLAGNDNTILLVGEEFTGPRSFVDFWMEEIRKWEDETGIRVHIGLGATKDVTDGVLSDPAKNREISTIDLRYWRYESGRNAVCTYRRDGGTPEGIPSPTGNLRNRFTGR